MLKTVFHIRVSGRLLPEFRSYGGSKIAPSHWLDTSLIQQLVATAQAVMIAARKLWNFAISVAYRIVSSVILIVNPGQHW